jgi:feruloyl esterase
MNTSSYLPHTVAKPSESSRYSFKQFAAACMFVLLTVCASSQTLKPSVSCESLARLDLPEVTITMAVPVAAGQFHGGPVADSQLAPLTPAGAAAHPFPSPDNSPNPAFCRVAATLKPSGDSDIKMEIWLPLTNWNGKFMGAGNFGWAGDIRYDGLMLGIRNGYAVASNDTGHDRSSGQTAEFAVGHPEKVIDYGWRANHAMTLDSKAIIKSFYGAGPKHSYWVGCSLGGEQGMMEVERFPQDYDGALIGQPPWPLPNMNAGQIWPTLLERETPGGTLTAKKTALIQDAIKNQCATPVDLKLGYINDPDGCHFDPNTLLCKGADADDCLTAAQVDRVTKLHNGLINTRTGEHITLAPEGWGNGPSLTSMTGFGGAAGPGPGGPGGAGPGGPNGGPGGPGPAGAAPAGARPPGGGGLGASPGQPMGVALALYKYLVFQDPNWDWKTLDFDRDEPLAEKVLSTVFTAENPNLKQFFDHGGKLLLYEDTPETLKFYKDVLKTVGPEANNSIRVFNMPGMAHCSGGAGCDTFDKLGVIDAWVNGGPAPDRIVAVKSTDSKVTHPICAYPKVAKYKGTGELTDAASFVCAER